VARVVLVHGAFNELWGPHELKARWMPALRDGLWHHGADLDASEVEVCFYGDLFRRHPGTDADHQLKESRAGIAEALNHIAGGDALAALGEAANEAAFDRMVDMVTIMTTEPDLRDRLRARIESVVGSDTRVLVAHSLGSVLSYTALANHPGWAVGTFVTLGSPLGAPMAFDTLEPAPVGGRGAWPGPIERWVNVRAHNDKAAAVSLVEKFGSRVEEHLIDNGHRPHAPEPYLNASATGAAIAAALD
jgi:predicted alpha/beta hydrolase family esterase